METSIAPNKPVADSKKESQFTIMDGNQAAVHIAYKTSEV